jgi:hypothetical protein
MLYQQSKIQGTPCGDVMQYYRDTNCTTIALADGLGSGLKANIAATLICTRLIELIKNDYTLREAFSAVASTMNKAWGTEQPFAVFTLVRVQNSGSTTALTYEMPPPLLVTKTAATVMVDKTYTLEKAIVIESSFKCKKGESIILVSDGITQAGLGQGLTYGWGVEGLSNYICQKLVIQEYKNSNLSEDIVKQANRLWAQKRGDDCTAVHIKSRNGIIVNILTGPPKNSIDDAQIIKEFINQRGIKIVSGGTTAKMVARELKLHLEVKGTNKLNTVSPPSFNIDGINLVTEGIVTLNHVYNLIDEDTAKYMDESDVFEFCEFLKLADKVNFFIGNAANKGLNSIKFRQQRILPRTKIIPLIIKWLQEKGKLVVVKNF